LEGSEIGSSPNQAAVDVSDAGDEERKPASVQALRGQCPRLNTPHLLHDARAMSPVQQSWFYERGLASV